MTTVTDIISKALSKISSKRPGDSIPANDLADAFIEFKQIISELEIDDFLVPANTLDTVSVANNINTYLLYDGATGNDFNIARPAEITKVIYRKYDPVSSAYSDYPLKMLSVVEYLEIPLKGTQGQSQYWAWDYNRPTGQSTFYLAPTPNANDQLLIYSVKPLSAFITVTDSLGLPPWMEGYLVYTLALRLAPEYKVPVSPQDIVFMTQMRLENKIKNFMAQQIKLKVDATLLTNNRRIYTSL